MSLNVRVALAEHVAQLARVVEELAVLLRILEERIAELEQAERSET